MILLYVVNRHLLSIIRELESRHKMHKFLASQFHLLCSPENPCINPAGNEHSE